MSDESKPPCEFCLLAIQELEKRTLSVRDFDKEQRIMIAKVVALEIQLSNIRTAVYVVMAIIGSTMFLGLWKWAIR